MDIPLVVQHIIAAAPGYSNKPVDEVTASVHRLIAHWRGNHKSRGGKLATERQQPTAASSDCEDEKADSSRPADTNMMNKQVRAAVAARKSSEPAAGSASKKSGDSASKRRRSDQGSGQRRVRGRTARVDRMAPREAAPEGEGGKEFTQAERPPTRLKDMGGVELCLQAIRELIEWPLAHPEVYAHLGVEPPRGILLHGPPGCGKTMLAHAIAGELGVPFFKLVATEVVAGTSGESERLIRDLFEKAKAAAPAILFIDEVDSITGKRENAQVLPCSLGSASDFA